MENSFDNHQYCYDFKDMIIKIGNEEIINYRIKDIQISFEANTHSKLQLVLKNDEENQDIYKGLQGQNKQTIEIIVKKSDKKDSKNEIERYVFKGQIESFEIASKDKKDFEIRLEALSLSKELDREVVFRVFQNTELTLAQILDKIIEKYKKNILITYNDELKNIKILKPIVQYEESDWNFLIRVASQIGFGVFPCSNGSIKIGLIKSKEQNKNIPIVRNEYGVRKNNWGDIQYTFLSDNLLLNSDEVKLFETVEENGETRQQEISLNVYKGKICLERGRIRAFVEMIMEEYRFEYIPNEKIAGKIIEGVVENIVSSKENIAKMTLNLTSGLEKKANLKRGKKGYKRTTISDEEKRFNFPYMTPYSQTNTGFFCTPEPGDRVAVFFPSTDESEAYVMGAVNSPGNGRFSDYTIRNFTIKGDKTNSFDLQVAKDKMKIEATDTSLINKNELSLFGKNTIKNESEAQIIIDSKQNITISSKETQETVTTKKEFIKNKTIKGKTISFEYSDIALKGNVSSS